MDGAPVGERRRWSDEFKAQAVTAALEPGINVSALARRLGISPPQLFGWRRAFLSKQSQGCRGRRGCLGPCGWRRRGVPSRSCPGRSARPSGSRWQRCRRPRSASPSFPSRQEPARASDTHAPPSAAYGGAIASAGRRASGSSAPPPALRRRHRQ
ncbi:transposase [Cereibacter changlensis]|uniref:transposase n=1 Tax=Cereibacter changlensis TaxID=402884 RepID=UPI003D156A48